MSREHLWQMNSEATYLGAYLGHHVFVKGIGASDKHCQMGALAGLGGAAQVAFLYSWQASSKPCFKDICVKGCSL